MAGGMTGGGWGRRGLGIPLAERVSMNRATAGPTPGGVSPARHCWVARTVGQDDARWPGLLVEWRQTSTGWEGRVLYSARLPEGDQVPSTSREWVVVEEWLPADRLTPL